MNYEETMCTIKTFLDSPEGIQTFGGHIVKFHEAVDLIEKHVERMEKGEKIIATEEDIKIIQRTINLSKSFLLELPITKGLTDFINFYGLLVRNWADNCGKNESQLVLDIVFLQRFIRYHFTSTEILELLPHMMQKIMSMHNIGLPSIELARHYLDSLEKTEKK